MMRCYFRRRLSGCRRLSLFTDIEELRMVSDGKVSKFGCRIFGNNHVYTNYVRTCLYPIIKLFCIQAIIFFDIITIMCIIYKKILFQYFKLQTISKEIIV